eukprot:9474920-Pyramimonas_sp.AAC.1
MLRGCWTRQPPALPSASQVPANHRPAFAEEAELSEGLRCEAGKPWAMGHWFRHAIWSQPLA